MVAIGLAGVSNVGVKPDQASSLPTGHITFLFTDLEDSSATWEKRPSDARKALRYHDRTAEQVTVEHNGILVKHTGDGVESVFTNPGDAVAAAVDMQRRFQLPAWDGVERMRVRVGLHCGEASPDGDDYYGGVINRAARVADAANGDQIAVTEAVATAAGNQISGSVAFTDCGIAQLKGCGQERIFLVSADDLLLDERPLRIRRALAGSDLPAETSRLVDRIDVREAISEYLRERRLISLIGLGGIGKTRVAVAVARENHNLFDDGVVFCPLGPIAADGTDPTTSVVEALAEALGARPQPGHDLLGSIVNFVEDRRVLVVIDNCEHVKEAVRAAVQQLLSVNGPTVLITSREPLDLVGEQRLNLEPLDVQSYALELLTERALERDPGFDAGSNNDTLRQICRQLDGIPLALELAAARLRILSPEQLLDGLNDRFRLLGSGAGSNRGPNPLEATVAWSFEQLDTRQQHVLESLCVFSGGFTLEAVSAVLGVDDQIELLDDLTDLVEISLIRNRPGHGEIRFHMLETIRHFGLTRLKARVGSAYGLPSHDQLLAAHADFYTELALSCGRRLMTDSEADVWTTIDTEGDNTRAAFDTLVRNGDFGKAKDLVVSQAWFATLSMRMELFGWVDRLLDEDPLAQSAELWAVKSIGQYLSANHDAMNSAETSLELDTADPTGLARTTLASIALNNTFDSELSERATAGMLANLSDDLPEQRVVAYGLRAFHLCLREPTPEASAMAERAMAEAAKTGSASALTIAYWARAVSNLIVDGPVADEAIKEGLAMANSLTNNHLITHLINGLVVHFSSLTGSVEEAAAINAAEIRATMDKHYLVGASHLLGAGSVILARAGRPKDGAALLGAMIGNGHRPRRDIRKALEAALGEQMDDALAVGQGWSIKKAGIQAVAWLDELVDQSGELPDRFDSETSDP